MIASECNDECMEFCKASKKAFLGPIFGYKDIKKSVFLTIYQEVLGFQLRIDLRLGIKSVTR